MYVSQNKYTPNLSKTKTIWLFDNRHETLIRGKNGIILSNILKSGINCYTSSQMIYLQRNA